MIVDTTDQRLRMRGDQLVDPRSGGVSRRDVLRRSVTLASLAALGGCDFTERDATQRALRQISKANDRAQALLFNPMSRAKLFPESALTVPFRFNAFYSEASVPEIDVASWKLSVSGRVEDKGAWPLAALRALPAITESTRLCCIEGWSAIGKWTGVPLATFLDRVGADKAAKYVGFRCADKYYTSIDMASALHPQTMLAYGFAGASTLPEQFGLPLRLRIPTKLGFKNPKHLVELFVSNEFTSGFWEDLQGYNWFGGL